MHFIHTIKQNIITHSNRNCSTSLDLALWNGAVQTSPHMIIFCYIVLIRIQCLYNISTQQQHQIDPIAYKLHTHYTIYHYIVMKKEESSENVQLQTLIIERRYKNCNFKFQLASWFSIQRLVSLASLMFHATKEHIALDWVPWAIKSVR